jgi:hypothetical protein
MKNISKSTTQYIGPSQPWLLFSAPSDDALCIAPKPIAGAEERRVGTELMKHTAVVWPAPRLHLDRSTSEGVIRATAFVARCSGAATLAYLISFWIGLPYPVWSTISALIVSHEKLSETRSLLNDRILGTVLGIGVAIGIAAGTSQFGATVSTQIALGVALCAIVAREWPSLRVGMWSSSIVVLTAHDSSSMAMTAFYSGSVVILGAVIGGSFHWAAEIMVAALMRCTGTLVQESASIRSDG